MRKQILVFLILFSGFSKQSEAQILQQFNFSGAAGSEVTLPPDAQPSNGNVSPIRRGSGLQPSAAANVFSATGFTTNASLDTADYLSFSLKANQGYKLRLDSLLFGQRKSNSGPANYTLRTSLDNFQADIASGISSNPITWDNRAVFGPAFNAITSGQSLEIRFYGFGATAASGTWRLDSIRIFGSINPEGVVVSKPKLNFSPASLTFTESAGAQQATLQFSAQPSVEVSGALFVKSGSASSGIDYEGFTSIPFSFTPGGNLSFSKPVNFLDDALTEPSETLVLVARKTGLVSDSAYEIGNDSLFTFNISDNDAPAPVSGLLQQYNFTGAAGGEANFPPDGQPLNGTLSNMKRGSGLQPAAAGNVFNASGFTSNASSDTADYFSFSIKANTGFQLNLDSLVFGQRKSNSGPANYAIRSSLDNFQADLSTGLGSNTISWNNKAILGAAFTGISSVQTTEFRIYGYAATATSGTWRIDSVRIYGNISPGGGVVSKPKLTFSPASLTFTESAGPKQATLQFSAQPSVEVSGALFVKSGTAAAGSDYQGFTSIPFTFSPGGNLSFTKSVDFLDDALTEPSETLVLVARKTGLVSDSAYDIGPDSLFTFTITDNDAPAPPSLATRTIAQIKGANTGNQADSVGKSFRVYGTVYGLNQRLSATAGGYQMFIRDATGGIGIFKNAPVSGVNVLNEGDSVRVMGKIEGFRGLSQINPDSIVVIATGISLKTPDLISTMGESDEGNLVRIEGLEVNPVTWTTGLGGGGFTAKAFNGTDSIAIRVDNDCNLFNQPVPSGTFAMTGMVGQFVPGNPAPVAPFPASGYQLIPRSSSDLVITTGLNTKNGSGLLSLHPNPGTDKVRLAGFVSQEETLRISDLSGRIMKEMKINTDSRNIDVSSLPQGVYLFKFIRTGKVIRWAKSSQ